MNDLISRQAAIDALWKALFEYEDKTEKQFQESEDLDVGDWIGHRIFVQNMNDIDRQTILNLPSAQPDVPDTNVGDLISRQAAIDALHMHLMYRMGTDSNKKRLDEWINNLPSVQPEQRWIPCSERLPEAPGFVNCTCHSLIDNREDWVVETFYMPQPSGSPYSDWGNIPMLNDGECEVVAWMYRNIPEPYKAETERRINNARLNQQTGGVGCCKQSYRSV